MAIKLGLLHRKGLSFDKIEGSVTSNEGLVLITDAIQIQGASSEIHISGTVDLKHKSVDNKMVVILPIGSNLTWVAAVVGGLPAMAGVYVVTKVLKDQVERFSSAAYSIKGGWDEPNVKFEKLFSNKPKKSTGEREQTLTQQTVTPQKEQQQNEQGQSGRAADDKQ